MTSQSENVTATAGIQGNGAGGRGLMPLSLSCPGGSCSGTCGGYFAGTTYTMKQDQSQTSLSGNWGALALGGNGASVYQNNLEVGYTGTISSTVSSEPGNIVGPTSQGIADRVAAGVAADPTIAAGSAPSSASAALTTYAYDPRLIVVPMVDFSAKCAGSSKGGKNTDLPVVEYAQMWLLGTSGNNATISAVYLGTLTSPPSGSSAVANFGLMTPVLQN